MKEIDKQELEQLKNDGKKILLDFYGTWCGPCKVLMPQLEELEKKKNDVTFVKMDVDQNQKFAIDLGVRSIPTVIIYNGTKEVNKSSGVRPIEFYDQILNSLS